MQDVYPETVLFTFKVGKAVKSVRFVRRMSFECKAVVFLLLNCLILCKNHVKHNMHSFDDSNANRFDKHIFSMEVSQLIPSSGLISVKLSASTCMSDV